MVTKSDYKNYITDFAKFIILVLNHFHKKIPGNIIVNTQLSSIISLK